MSIIVRKCFVKGPVLHRKVFFKNGAKGFENDSVLNPEMRVNSCVKSFVNVLNINLLNEGDCARNGKPYPLFLKSSGVNRCR